MIAKTCIRSFVVAALTICSLSTAIFAQSAQTQSASVPTTLATKATKAPTNSMSFDEVSSIQRGAARVIIGQQLAAIPLTSFVQKLKGSFEDLTNGKTIQFASTLAKEGAVTSQNMLNVKVNYESRPIGGILTVRVELVPVFAGIGSASRPLSTLEVSQAVDDMDESTVHQIVADLSHKLGTQYASQSN